MGGNCFAALQNPYRAGPNSPKTLFKEGKIYEKKQKKLRLLSLFMALILAASSLSAVFSVNAEEPYTPVYSEKVSREDISLMLEDINTILSGNVLNGGTIETIWKALPSLKSILMLSGPGDALDTVKFYQTIDPERFADLTGDEGGKIISDTVNEQGEITQQGSFGKFFDNHPVECTDLAAFQTELNGIVDAVVQDNVLSTLFFAMLIGGGLEQAQSLGTGLDEICSALGVEQETTANDALGFTGTVNKDATRTYIKNIIAAVFPDAANNAVSIVQHVLVDENAASRYSGLSKVINSLNTVVGALADTLKSLGVDVDSLVKTLADLQADFSALPTIGEGESEMLDIEGCVSYLVSDLTDDALTIEFVNRTENTPASKALISVKFRHMQLDRVANAQSTADAFKIVFDYLYDNLIADSTNNSLIKMAISTGIIDSVLSEPLTPEIKTFILDLLEMENTEAANELIVYVANAAGREIPENPETPDDPGETPTDPEKPDTKPSPGDDDADKNSQDGSENKKNSINKNTPIGNSSLTSPSTGAPYTTENIAVPASIAAAFAALSALGIWYILKKKRAVTKLNTLTTFIIPLWTVAAICGGSSRLY